MLKTKHLAFGSQVATFELPPQNAMSAKTQSRSRNVPNGTARPAGFIQCSPSVRCGDAETQRIRPEAHPTPSLADSLYGLTTRDGQLVCVLRGDAEVEALYDLFCQENGQELLIVPVPTVQQELEAAYA